MAEHPFARQREAGVLVTLNSDDPGMMRFDVADEYVAVARAYGYSLEDMEAISLAGIDACWAPDEEKQALRDPLRRRVRPVARRELRRCTGSAAERTCATTILPDGPARWLVEGQGRDS